MPDRPTFRAPDWLLDALVLLIAAACLFWGLGGPAIRDNNEALYADIAWAMARGGSWVIPHLDGVPYIEKPPLLYWLMAATFKLFGVGAWQARLPDALAAWLICAGSIAYGRLVKAPLAGRFAALVSGTALGFVLVARTILFDPLMLLFWLAALGGVVLAIHARKRLWLRLAAAAVGLATLTKGPEALLLLGLIAVLHLLFSPGAWRRGELLRFLLDPWAIAIFILVTTPWHLAAVREQPGFAWFYFVNETIMRFLGKRIPDDYHTGPWWYYGPKLVLGFFQWTAVLALLAWRGPRLDGHDAGALCARWARNAALVLTIFFSAAGNKGAYYLLPVVPLVGWWLGVKLDVAERRGELHRLLPWLGAGAALFAVAALILWGVSHTAAVDGQFTHWGLPAAQFARLPSLFAAVALSAGLGAALWWRRKLHPGLLVFGLSAVVMSHYATELAIAKTDDTSQKNVAAALHAALPGGAELFSWQTFEDHDASLLLYGFRPLRVIDSTSSDLWFGCRHAQGHTPCVGPSALEQARSEGRAVAVWVARSRLPTWLASGLGHGLQRLDFKDSVVFIGRRTNRSSAPAPENPPALP